MGLVCCSRDKGEIAISFTDNEKRVIKQLFKNLSVGSIISESINEKALQDFFKENTQLGTSLYNFMKKNSPIAKINLEVFLYSVEVLIKEPSVIYLSEYNTLEKMEIFGLLSMKKYNVMRKQDLNSLKVSYQEGFEYIMDILRIFKIIDNRSKVEDVAARSLMNSIFEFQDGDMPWMIFMHTVKRQLIHLNSIVKFYFVSKFLSTKMTYRLPDFNSKPTLLTEEYLALLYMNNAYVQSTTHLSLIYSSNIPAKEFNRMVDSLLNYNGPTLMLFHHEEIIDEKSHSYIYGAFSQSRWRNTEEYQGNSESCVFSLFPKFRTYMALPSKKGAKHYNYLCFGNSSTHTGIGFGGNESKSTFRVWFDDKNNSFITKEDGTFEPGYLGDSFVNRTNIKYMEIWGLSNNPEKNSEEIIQEARSSYLKSLQNVETMRNTIGHPNHTFKNLIQENQPRGTWADSKVILNRGPTFGAEKSSNEHFMERKTTDSKYFTSGFDANFSNTKSSLSPSVQNIINKYSKKSPDLANKKNYELVDETPINEEKEEFLFGQKEKLKESYVIAQYNPGKDINHGKHKSIDLIKDKDTRILKGLIGKEHENEDYSPDSKAKLLTGSYVFKSETDKFPHGPSSTEQKQIIDYRHETEDYSPHTKAHLLTGSYQFKNEGNQKNIIEAHNLGIIQQIEEQKLKKESHDATERLGKSKEIKSNLENIAFINRTTGQDDWKHGLDADVVINKAMPFQKQVQKLNGSKAHDYYEPREQSEAIKYQVDKVPLTDSVKLMETSKNSTGSNVNSRIRESPQTGSSIRAEDQKLIEKNEENLVKMAMFAQLQDHKMKTSKRDSANEHEGSYMKSSKHSLDKSSHIREIQGISVDAHSPYNDSGLNKHSVNTNNIREIEEILGEKHNYGPAKLDMQRGFKHDYPNNDIYNRSKDLGDTNRSNDQYESYFGEEDDVRFDSKSYTDMMKKRPERKRKAPTNN